MINRKYRTIEGVKEGVQTLALLVASHRYEAARRLEREIWEAAMAEAAYPGQDCVLSVALQRANSARALLRAALKTRGVLFDREASDRA